MAKKILALVLAVVMCATMIATLASCGKDDEKLGEGAELLPRNTITKTEGVTIPADFKIGLICLHDENSTYDKNFMDAAKAVQAELGLSDDQVMFKTNIP